MTVEIHFKDKRFLNVFENIKYDKKEFEFTDLDNRNHIRIIFRDNKINIDKPANDISKLVKKAIYNLTYFHKKFGKEFVNILRSEQSINKYFLSKPKLVLGIGSVFRSKYYKPVS